MAEFKKNGFSLVEVLVSILVLALGVIGAAGMQLAALRTTQQSALQTFALQLAAEMADAIRANASSSTRKADESPFLGLDYQSATDGEPMAPGKFCYANSCDAQEFAEFEIYDWKKRVRGALPRGRVLVCRDSAPWDSGKKVLTWECSGSSGMNDPVVIKLGWQAKNPDGSLIKDGDNMFPPSVAVTVAL